MKESKVMYFFSIAIFILGIIKYEMTLILMSQIWLIGSLIMKKLEPFYKEDDEI